MLPLRGLKHFSLPIDRGNILLATGVDARPTWTGLGFDRDKVGIAGNWDGANPALIGCGRAV
jgi:hypothetical protein